MAKFLKNTVLAAVPAAVFILPLSSAPAEAQQLCSQRGKVIGQFAKVYQENPVAGGLTRDGRLIEVLSTGDGSTWTIVISKPSGETCVMMAGEGWRPLKLKAVELGPKA
jgi:hypothetical protein